MRPTAAIALVGSVEVVRGASPIHEINALEALIADADADMDALLWRQAECVVALLEGGMSQRALAREWLNVKTGRPYVVRHVQVVRQVFLDYLNSHSRSRPRFRTAYNAVTNAVRRDPERPVPQVHWSQLSREQQREVRRIAAELEQFPYVPHVFLEVFRCGSSPEVVPGAAGAPVYWDIVGGNPETAQPVFRYTRGEVLAKLREFIDGGPRSVISDLTVDVAQRRLKGDPTLAPPSLPSEAGESSSVWLSADTISHCVFLSQVFKTSTREATVAAAMAFVSAHFRLMFDEVDDDRYGAEPEF